MHGYWREVDAGMTEIRRPQDEMEESRDMLKPNGRKMKTRLGRKGRMGGRIAQDRPYVSW